MCEMLGFSAKREFDITNVLSMFYKHSNRHKDGWGLATYDGHPAMSKEPMRASSSTLLRNILSNSVVSKLAIAHIRLISRGGTSYTNTHPFIRRLENTEWIFAHNGTCNLPTSNRAQLPLGTTDSEEIFCQLLLVLQGISDWEVGFDRIHSTLINFSAFGKLNALFTNGKQLFAFCNKPGTLYYINNDNFILFATAPLDFGRGHWKEVQVGEFFLVQDGSVIKRGRKDLIPRNLLFK